MVAAARGGEVEDADSEPGGHFPPPGDTHHNKCLKFGQFCEEILIPGCHVPGVLRLPECFCRLRRDFASPVKKL